ncbi:hypothetical protein GUITHDRAFT_153344 [Guillardia theta CCMP2712]|uniref:Tetraspanin n=2 Tax=Guillardia theta TaxID=55529 RepID=L1J4L5_GUITC|nr:hypothetical protein GUITHDRAFT_153344 [Guillardia theta CCMP2712]EKX43069.1 hypothetical protein GUITHDRAFT_153344 [Guillardia theta CCMP2712]|eukprot:XP_005830049.1 hypothetical protein GUITHDRAFT_153344 [Guillardia theta CCMP2712]
MATPLCGAKAARRHLILINIGIFFLGFVFIIVGAVTLSHGQLFQQAIDRYCSVECKTINCQARECSSSLPSCDCSTGRTLLPAYFYAPASGLIAVGVFSLVTSVLGCIGAIRHKAPWLCGYILAISFVLLLQFSFGVAAALVSGMDRIPDVMMQLFDTQYKDFDWEFLRDFLPQACYIANSTRADRSVTHFPACAWNGTCDTDTSSRMPVNCCTANNMCDFGNSKYCTSSQKCVSGFLSSVGTPVAVACLLTLVLEIFAIWWACIIRRETRPGGVFDPSRNHL